MPSEIHYCDKCGSIILPSTIEQGSAVVNAATTLCAECLKKLAPDEREAISALRAGAGTPDAMPMTAPVRVYPGDRRSRESTRGRAAAPAGGKKARAAGPVVTAVAVGIGAAVVSALVGIHLLRSGDSGPPHRPRATPTVSAPTAPPVAPSSSGAAPASGATGAARQLARIRETIRAELVEHAEARKMLTRFSRSFAGTPEAESAKKLLSEIDVAHTKSADEALAAALAQARARTSKGKFDEAESVLRSLETRSGAQVWFESKGKAAVATALSEIAELRAAHELKSVADTLQKARHELSSGRLKAASELIANRAKWPAESRAKANELASEIKREVAAAAAAKKRAEERAAMLAGFDRLMIAGSYADARDYARSKAAAGGRDAEILRGGEDLARRLTEEPAARMRGVKTLIGRETRLKLITKHMTGIIKAATATELIVATTFTINNQTRERSNRLKWSALHADQLAEFARLGGAEMSRTDKAARMTYAALASKDLDAAGRSVRAAGGDPLGKYLVGMVQGRVSRRVCESAVKRARELVEKDELEDALGECKKALDAIPNDEEAATLFARVRKLLESPREIKLDLGNGVSMVFIYIKPGTFMMGSDSDPKHNWQGVEKPKHQVEITKGFYLGKYEVTQEQYEAVKGANPSRWKEANRPVEQVSWTDAAEFCRLMSEKTRRNVRFPTEAEWEYACRAGTTTDWSHGSDSANFGEWAWYNGNAGGQTHPVGQKKPNAWGLCDMHGNVYEWVSDWYDAGYYASSPGKDPTGPTAGARRLVRGGGWYDASYPCRSAIRDRQPPTFRHANLGFRAAVSSPPRGR